MKKLFITACLVFLTLLICSSCTPKSPGAGDSGAGMSSYTDAEFGISMSIPSPYYTDGTLAIVGKGDMPFRALTFSGEGYKELLALMEDGEMENLSKEEQGELVAKLTKQTFTLFEVKRYNEQEFAEAKDEISKNNGDVIDSKDGYTYVYSELDNDSSELSESDLALYKECQALIPGIRDSIKLISVGAGESSLEGAFPAFSSTDLNGNPVTNDIFKGKRVTMINFWGTFCGPCIEEMPDLGEIARNMPDDVQLIGIVSDATSDDMLELAKTIVDKANAAFTNIVPDAALTAYCDNIIGYPTTIFVDENGNLLGEPVVGTCTYEQYWAILEGYMNA